MKNTTNKKMIKCPICDSISFEYEYWTDGYWGTVEQHGYCYRCGYVIEQAYTPCFEAFWDIKRGFKSPSGKYFPKNIKRHKRIRKKLGIKNIEINPRWVYYI